MAVTYFYLDKDKKVIKERINTACFGSVQFEEEGKKAVYFRYLVHPSNTISKESVLEYINFLNSIKWFPQINVKEFTENYTYTFKIKNKNSFKIFALFTAIRYLEEYPSMVKFILKNRDKKISRIKLLLAASYQKNAGGHGLIGYPDKLSDFTSYKLSKEKFKPDDKIVSTGLHKFFGDWLPWGSMNTIREEVLEHYNLTLV